MPIFLFNDFLFFILQKTAKLLVLETIFSWRVMVGRLVVFKNYNLFLEILIQKPPTTSLAPSIDHRNKYKSAPNLYATINEKER